MFSSMQNLYLLPSPLRTQGPSAFATGPAQAATYTGARPVDLGAIPAHANHPCSIQPPCPPGGANTHARCPREVSTM